MWRRRRGRTRMHARTHTSSTVRTGGGGHRVSGNVHIWVSERCLSDEFLSARPMVVTITRGRTVVAISPRISAITPFPSGSRIHGYIICTHLANTTLSGRRNVRSAVPTRRACLKYMTNPAWLRAITARAAHCAQATILPAGGGAEESPRPVTRQRHKQHAALDRVSVPPSRELTSSRACNGGQPNEIGN